MKRATTRCTNWSSPSADDRSGKDEAALAGRPHAAQPADRRHRQHPPCRVLHRQAVFAGFSATGRLGLLELRAFEMPPHARMSLAQQLLLRALVARFWETPYTPPRWCAGAPSCTTASCCRILSSRTSPTCWKSCGAGYPHADEWFAPHFEFRFPKSATSPSRASSWNCASTGALACAGRGGRRYTVRYVDSSVERVQVKVDRHGAGSLHHLQRRAGAAAPTGKVGEFVAGVRYRAWQPANCLHPTIGVHAPLVFDLSTPGCSARWAAASTMSPIRAGAVSTPCRSTPSRPKAGRLARFFRFPFTLDLRRS
jgi:uncharacterized protein (DUF2126 family)